MAKKANDRTWTTERKTKAGAPPVRVRVADGMNNGRKVLLEVSYGQDCHGTFISRGTALEIAQAIIASAERRGRIDWSES